MQSQKKIRILHYLMMIAFAPDARSFAIKSSSFFVRLYYLLSQCQNWHVLLLSLTFLAGLKCIFVTYSL